MSHQEINLDMQGSGDGLSKKVVFQSNSTSCACPILMIKWFGALLAVVNVSVDILYAYKSPYAITLIFQLTIACLIARALITFGIGQYYYTKFVRNWKPSMSGMDEDKDREYEADEEDDAQDENAESRKYAEVRK